VEPTTTVGPDLEVDGVIIELSHLATCKRTNLRWQRVYSTLLGELVLALQYLAEL